MEFLNKIHQFFSYWYVRYLLATELYMVETWEKIVVQFFFLSLFVLAWCFNYCIVLNGVAQLRGTNNYAVLVS